MPEASLADVLVPIDAAPQRLLRVVQMKHLEPVEPDDAPEGAERSGISLRRDDVVAGCEQVTRVETDADPPMPRHPVDDRGKLFERGAERRPLPGGVLEQHHRFSTRAAREEFRQAVRNQRQTLRRAARGIAPGMENDAAQSQRLRAVDLVCHRRHRLLAQGTIGGGQVDQVARVRHHRFDTGSPDARTECAHLGRRRLAAPPLVGILGEDLQRGAPVRDRAIDGEGQAAGHRHVRAKPRAACHRPSDSPAIRPSGAMRTTRANGSRRAVG